MSPKVADMMAQAQELSEDERRELLVQLLDAAVDPEVERAWTDEAKRRAAEVDAGTVATLSHDEVMGLIAADD